MRGANVSLQGTQRREYSAAGLTVIPERGSAEWRNLPRRASCESAWAVFAVAKRFLVPRNDRKPPAAAGCGHIQQGRDSSGRWRSLRNDSKALRAGIPRKLGMTLRDVKDGRKVSAAGARADTQVGPSEF